MKKIFLVGIILMALLKVGFAKADSTTVAPFNTVKFTDLNSFHLNLLGNGILGSISYERILLNRADVKIGAELGSNIFLNTLSTTAIFSFTRRNYCEIGVGGTIGLLSGINGKFGYRYQNPTKHFVFRVGFMPTILLTPLSIVADSGGLKGFFPWFGLSFGTTF